MSGKAELRKVLSRFDLESGPVDASPHPGGHINDSWLVTIGRPDGAVRGLLQRVNGSVFPDPPALMDNISRVVGHLARSLAAEGVPDAGRRVLSLVPARDGGTFIRDGLGDCWRLYRFIEGARNLLAVTSPAEAEAGGRAFGEFQRRLADLPGPRLHESIAGFHDTPRRYADLERAVEADAFDRAAAAREEIGYAMGRRGDAGVLLEARRQGRVPERVVHNDAKISNVLFDGESGEGLCVVDLDTVMPGLSLYDFGDMVRTMTGRAAEDDAGTDAGVDPVLFEALAGGYLSEMGPLLTAGERGLLVASGQLITLEIGVRFLTDFLRGDAYFRTAHPEHNLQRCRAQFAHHRSLTEAAPALQRLAMLA